MHAADVLLVPLIPTTLSVRTLDQLTEFVSGFNGRRPEVRAFFSMVDRRKKLHQEVIQTLLAERPGVALTAIPALSLIERMSVERAPVTAFAPRSQAARAYRALWSELRATDALLAGAATPASLYQMIAVRRERRGTHSVGVSTTRSSGTPWPCGCRGSPPWLVTSSRRRHARRQAPSADHAPPLVRLNHALEFPRAGAAL